VKFENPEFAIWVTGKPSTVVGMTISEAVAKPLATETSVSLFMSIKDKPGETSDNP
jgi:hypothetical protein